MSQAGWYPDPGGQPGMFRYWDGRAWSQTVSPTPFGGGPQGPQQPLLVRASDAGPAAADTLQEGRRRRPIGAFLVIALVVVGLVVGGGALLTGGLLSPGAGNQGAPSNPTDFCPPQPLTLPTMTQRAQPAGRVQGGMLSYPLLGAPWNPPNGNELRVPFGRDVMEQNVILHPNYDGLGHSWVASVLVAELDAGDGFFSPQQGAEIVSRCLMGEFYGDAVLTRTDLVNEATSVDGRDAWLLEMHLDFSIPDLSETGETAIILIVSTGEASSSLYYASIPDSRPDLLAESRQVQQNLRVES